MTARYIGISCPPGTVRAPASAIAAHVARVAAVESRLDALGLHVDGYRAATALQADRAAAGLCIDCGRAGQGDARCAPCASAWRAEQERVWELRFSMDQANRQRWREAAKRARAEARS